MPRCEECIHKNVCLHKANIQTDTYAYMGVSYDTESCKHFTPTADVVPKSEEGAECPTCHGTGRIGTTGWLTKNISKEQLAKEKAEAIAEHELHIKQDYAREIFAEIDRALEDAEFEWGTIFGVKLCIAELKKKYTQN